MCLNKQKEKIQQLAQQNLRKEKIPKLSEMSGMNPNETI